MEQILTDEQNTARGTTVAIDREECSAAMVYQSALTASCYEIIDGDSRPGYVIPSSDIVSL
jgi:hypothetical protein